MVYAYWFYMPFSFPPLQIQTVKQTQKEPKKLGKRFLFKWKNNSEYGSLCSVAEPNQYLHVSDKKIALSSDPDHRFRVKESSNLKMGMHRTQTRRVEQGHAMHGVQRKAMKCVATRRGTKRQRVWKLLVREWTMSANTVQNHSRNSRKLQKNAKVGLN